MLLCNPLIRAGHFLNYCKREKMKDLIRVFYRMTVLVVLATDFLILFTNIHLQYGGDVFLVGTKFSVIYMHFYLISFFIADKNITSHGQVYESIGNFVLTFPTHKNYNNLYRELDLNTAIATTKYNVNGVGQVHQMFLLLQSIPAKEIQAKEDMNCMKVPRSQSILVNIAGHQLLLSMHLQLILVKDIRIKVSMK